MSSRITHLKTEIQINETKRFCYEYHDKIRGPADPAIDAEVDLI
jgi:hypothetical protein